LVASHTHYAPSLDPSKPQLGPVDPAYMAQVAGNIAAALAPLVRSPERREVALAVGQDKTNRLSVYRRSRRLHLHKNFPFFRVGITLQPNFGVAVDASVSAVVLRDHETQAIHAVLWNWACHPVAFPDNLAVSADYIGVVRDTIRRVLDAPGAPVLFLQGFGGDIRPNVIQQKRTWKSRLRVPFGPVFGAFDQDSYAAWCKAIAAVVTRCAKNAVPQPDKCALSLVSVTDELTDLIVGGDSRSALPPMGFHRLSFGAGVDIVMMGAEVVQGYKPMVARIFATDGISARPQTLLTAGYTGDVFGYLPTDRQIAEGGYEARGFFAPFSLKGHFRPKVEPVIAEALGRLAAGQK